MRTIAHLSDLHFGRIDASLLAPLRQTVAALSPDVVVVSGDLTQRARVDQFRAAREFLDTLPSPQIVVPGNHDVPLYNIVRRFHGPLDRYRRYITAEMEPFHADSEIAILGINSARSLTFKNGRINSEQIARMRERFAQSAPTAIRIVVTHHPFDVPEPAGNHIVGRAGMAMQALSECGVDLLLAGHLHVSTTISTAARHRIPGFAALVVQAGTATSTRRRDERNSFNLLHVVPAGIAPASVTVQPWLWNPASNRFEPSAQSVFAHSPEGWASA
jgi:3',5'-cyclic AMP phosphodiesterase CpdA